MAERILLPGEQPITPSITVENCLAEQLQQMLMRLDDLERQMKRRAVLDDFVALVNQDGTTAAMVEDFLQEIARLDASADNHEIHEPHEEQQ